MDTCLQVDDRLGGGGVLGIGRAVCLARGVRDVSIVGYARVSSSSQSLDIQLEQLNDAGCEKVFAEKQTGTSTVRRDELARAIDWVREGDVFVITRLDRLARSLVDLRGIIDQLTEKSVSFRCLQQHIDTTTSEGRLMLNMLGSFAEFETDLRRERQMEGIIKARAEGKYARASRVDRSLVVRMRDTDGLTLTQVAKAVGVHKTTILRKVPEGWPPSPFKKGTTDGGE